MGEDERMTWCSVVLVLVCMVHGGAGTGLGAMPSYRDETHPLLTVLHTEPHSITLLIKPMQYKQDTMVRLLYERVPARKSPSMLHLSDPVIEVIPLTRPHLSHTISELPMGKYIVCGQAMLMGEVFQASCFETLIHRLDTNTLQVGVKVIIVMSLVMVLMVMVYALCTRYARKRTRIKKR